MSIPDTRPIGIDLFAGAGGFSLGFEQAGFDIVAAVEIDPIHCVTHKYNFPNCTTLCSSVVDLTGNKIRQRALLGNRDIDVVFGGAPCQGFSLIGKRIFDDPRNLLVFHYVRLVHELQPKYCVFENVKGLTVGRHKQFLDELIALLHEAGYDVLMPYRVLNAADFAVPQNRHRLFLIGTRQGMPMPQYPEPTGTTTVIEAIGDLPDVELSPDLNSSDSIHVEFPTTATYARRLRGFDDGPTDFGYRRIFDPNLLTSSMRTTHTEVSKRRFAETPHGKIEPISHFFKLDPNGRCNTLRAGTDGSRGAFTSPRPIHPFSPRVITVREAARIHSYPDWFRFHVTKWHGFRQVGNSVPPLLGRAVASEIIKALGIKPCKPESIVQPGNHVLLTFDMSEAAKFFGVQTRIVRGNIANKMDSQNSFKHDID